jgi:hypothetical protein
MKFKIISALFSFALIGQVFSADPAAKVDTVWTGTASDAWADSVNWSLGRPSDQGVANTVIQNISNNRTPVVSTAGNTTAGEVYIMSGGSLVIKKGGELNTAGNFVTGNNGPAGRTDIVGGTLSVGGLLLIGHGGYEGSLYIQSGTVAAQGLSIDSSGYAKIYIQGTGALILPNSDENLKNVSYWIDNSALIVAEGGNGAKNATVDIDIKSRPGKIVLTVNPRK